ncbi:hypothetical protein BKA70DRAFT_1283082 [Coprinopsis sp. MPI-PUGE-AT-0042]|nr:hypothetical protein BKA70DRAFT_1283082 [Coprinopsis sp. MPI-PUGE-AT-0042]
MNTQPQPHTHDSVSAVPAWHPKLTVSRLLVIALTIGLGTAKAITAYRGETIAPVTIEWITSTLRYLVMSTLELSHNPKPAWLFQYDTLDVVWSLAKTLSFQPPIYETEEITVELLVKPRHAPITLYRLMVSLSALGFGLLKAALSYLGKTLEPTTVDWILGVVVTIGWVLLCFSKSLYCLGLYERILHTCGVAIWITTYTIGLLSSLLWTYLWSLMFYEVILGENSSHKTDDPMKDFLVRVVVTGWLPLVALLTIGQSWPGTSWTDQRKNS